MNKRRRVYVTAACATTLALAGVGTDLLVERKAEQRVAEAAGCRLGADVDAELRSSFAGLRALTGRVGTVHLSAPRMRREDLDMALQADLYGVSTDGGASGGSAAVSVTYAELGKRLDRSGEADGMAGMTLGSDGTRLTLSGTAGALQVPVSVRMDLSTTSHAVTLTPRAVNMLGREVAVSALSALPGAAEFADKLKPRTIEIGKLPAGVRLTGAEAASDGLLLRFGLTPEELSGDKGAACAPEGKQA
ncbi:DUF2993 domain-containing protein [Streptomyces sp. NPDC006284]|uniref:LmeA family phospholipid-binding protein n=1 Tax=Streptomyces sp. NPDC006284 TaxID=3156742 RepID=UPI0033A9440D